MILIYILLSLLLLSYWDWISFLFLFPAVRFQSRREYRDLEMDLTQDHTCKQPIKSERVNRQKASSASTSKKMKHFLSPLVQGYVRWMLVKTGRLPSHHLRDFLYRHVFLIDKASNASIYYGADIRAGINLHIGNGSIIGDSAILDARNGIIIGKNVNFSSGVNIWTEQHAHSDPDFECLSDNSFCVRIGDRVWIGPRVTILHSVNIGEGAVVAAGAVVTKDVEPFSIVAGIPAKKIGERNHNLRYELKGNHISIY